MIDVALHNRILFLLIPSLEKSASEAENLGKLTIACLRVMMARNLGSELEGSRAELLESKATEATYPYIAALDELGYYFSDGIAVMFAQARSLGISMIAAAQDLEKLTEGNRAAEAGAMKGNTVNKIFMKIDDPDKTYELLAKTVGKVNVAVHTSFEAREGSPHFKRDRDTTVQEMDMISFREMQGYSEGQAVLNALGTTRRISTFYMGHWLEKLNNTNYRVNRFLQVHDPSKEDVEEYGIPIPTATNVKKVAKAVEMMDILKGRKPLPPAPTLPVFKELARVFRILNEHQAGLGKIERGAVMYLALRHMLRSGVDMEAVEVPEDSIPASASILGSEEALGLAEALDEHGLPDPLSLIRKPLAEVLNAEAASAAPARAPAPPEPTRDSAPMPPMGFPPPPPTAASEPPFGFGFESASDPTIEDPIDEVLHAGRPAKSAAAWVTQAVGEAHRMVEKPRSADGTAVGLSDNTLRELAHLEEELGSSQPQQAAHTMQKVVAAQTTPDTIGRGELSNEQIESYFLKLMNDDGDEAPD